MHFVRRLLQDAVMVALICFTCTLVHFFIASRVQSVPLPIQALRFITAKSSPGAAMASSAAFHAGTSWSTTAKPAIGWRRLLPRIFAVVNANVTRKGRSFTIDYKHGRFLKDGEAFRFIAGTMHYFRVPRGSWKDRLLKMKMAGLNAVHATVEWSGHEPEKGEYNFRGNYNVGAFLRTAQHVGLLVLLSVGPYIGADRDNGGLPYWLLRGGVSMKFRCSNIAFTAAVEEWFDVLLLQLSPFLYRKGGPVIALEVEHKYGSYSACDRHYMQNLVKLISVHLGNQAAMFTTDLPDNVRCGSTKGALVALALSPGSRASKQFRSIRGPFVATLDISVADRWGFPRSRVDASLALRSFKELLTMNASVILNVFHGGTNFGFRNGAGLAPFTTSYDCGAPLSEAGDPTPLYYGIRKAIEDVVRLPRFRIPDWEPPLEIGKVELRCGPSPKVFIKHFRRKGSLKRAASKQPLSFEKLGQGFGWVSYKTKVNFQPESPSMLRGLLIKDRAYVYTKRSVLSVDSTVSQLPIAADKGEELEIVVENTGRSSWGNENHAMKGLLSVPTLAGLPLTGWTMEALPLTSRQDIDEITRLLLTAKQESSCKAPCFYSGNFTLPEGTAPRNTYLDLTGWTKGVAYINGFNLGRYWPAAGPQVTLFVPGSLLLPHPRQNLLLLFEIEGALSNGPTVELVNTSRLDGPTPTRAG